MLYVHCCNTTYSYAYIYTNVYVHICISNTSLMALICNDFLPHRTACSISLAIHTITSLTLRSFALLLFLHLFPRHSQCSFLHYALSHTIIAEAEVIVTVGCWRLLFLQFKLQLPLLLLYCSAYSNNAYCACVRRLHIEIIIILIICHGCLWLCGCFRVPGLDEGTYICMWRVAVICTMYLYAHSANMYCCTF